MDTQIVDSPIEFVGSWAREDGTTRFTEVTTVSNRTGRLSPYTSILRFAPLRNNSIDGGVYVYNINVIPINSAYVLPVNASQSIFYTIRNYPELNITQDKSSLGDCQPENCAVLYGNISLVSNTYSKRNITYTWSRGGIEVNRANGSTLLAGSYRIGTLTAVTIGSYDLEVCLTVFNSGLENHCSRTSYNIIVTGKLVYCGPMPLYNPFITNNDYNNS